jgi:hypothetical protein
MRKRGRSRRMMMGVRGRWSRWRWSTWTRRRRRRRVRRRRRRRRRRRAVGAVAKRMRKMGLWGVRRRRMTGRARRWQSMHTGPWRVRTYRVMRVYACKWM